MSNEKGSTHEWTAEEDAYCISFFIGSPLGSFSEFVGAPANLEKKSLRSRFVEIVRSPALSDRVLKFCRGDVLFHKKLAFSRLEDYYLAKSEQVLKTQRCGVILKHFGQFFSINRRPSSLIARHYRLARMGMLNPECLSENFEDFKQQLLSHYLTSKSIETKLTVDEIQALNTEIQPRLRNMTPPIAKLQAICAEVQKTFVRGDIAAFYAFAPAFIVRNLTTIIGRGSLLSKTDLDLSRFSLKTISRKHAVLKFCKDMHFYLECVGGYAIVNGEIVNIGQTALLRSGSIVDIGGIPMAFIEREELMREIRND